MHVQKNNNNTLVESVKEKRRKGKRELLGYEWDEYLIRVWKKKQWLWKYQYN